MKIIIYGNASSGKSTMARALSAQQGCEFLPLDNITWLEGAKRRPIHESIELLHQFIQKHNQWIIEGCYGDLVEAALPYCTELRFINPGVDVCAELCRKREWEPDKFATLEEHQANQNQLIEWILKYESRTDEFGLQLHRKIFDEFNGSKQEYTNINAYSQDRESN